ncbi:MULTISPECIES: hypothetical protein [Myroides]|uniref:hypothetical protein n=1 Tax=Myroides TaxID=76831 RepID=UPI000280A3AC|nr:MULTISPECIES: hypothetical protein [Myroides]APA90835.1 hypothetical protein BK054_00905 [Myroides sp. ZB35]EKB05062.1 hypothetical protein HMPREF9711_01525 [Myroides odoratimimus CCUG 3837]
MDKQQYINNAFEIILSKNLSTPFHLDPGSTVTDLNKYLKSLKSAYLSSVDPRLEKLFYDKIEALKAL